MGWHDAALERRHHPHQHADPHHDRLAAGVALHRGLQDAVLEEAGLQNTG